MIERLRLHRDQAILQLDRISPLFWRLTRHVLAPSAQFNDKALLLELAESPAKDATT